MLKYCFAVAQQMIWGVPESGATPLWFSWTSVFNYHPPAWCESCRILFSQCSWNGNQTHRQCWKWSHSKHVNTHCRWRVLLVMVWLTRVTYTGRSTEAFLCHIHTRTYTQCRSNNIRVGGDFRRWLTFGWASACLWVQLGLLTFLTPVKPACGIHDSIVASC